MFVWWGQVCALTIQTSVKFRNSSELPLSSLAKDVSLSNLTILLILRRSFQWCRRIFLTGICIKLTKPWKGLLATLTPFVRCAIDLTPDRSGSFSLRCQASLRPNHPPMGVVKRGGGWGEEFVSKLDQDLKFSSFNCGEGNTAAKRLCMRQVEHFRSLFQSHFPVRS